ncbi:centromere protein P [Trichomycterus rosablanca]|uniref:centromere protein P n=1 Tax=Trichomycterus rosablanca TaxID=2290929 RepID=UPI002F35ABD7
MEQKYEEQMKRLRQEIETYEAERDECLRSVSMQHGETLQLILKSIMNTKDLGEEAPNKDVLKLMREIGDTEKDLRRRAEISGIALTECFVRTLEKSQSKTIQQFRLAGHCCFLSFHVEFALTEIQDGENFLRRVTDLNIIADGPEFKDLCAFVSGVEETKSLTLFFQTLRTFAEKCEQRSRTFRFFKEKYPDVIRLPEGCRSEVMLIQTPQLPGCSMSVFWNVTVSKDGVVKPKLDLLMKMPEQAQKLDPESVTESAPESFRSLLNVLGVESTIESLVRSVRF